MSEKPRILLLAAGRRYSFVERLLKCGWDVYSAETDLSCPISTIEGCTIIPITIKCKVCACESEVDQISEGIKKYDIQYVLPLNDFWSAEADSEFSCIRTKDGSFVEVIGGDQDRCYDKKRFEEYMLSRFADLYPAKQLFSDAVIKPCFGNGSKGIQYVSWYNPRKWFPGKNNVVQRRIKGKEYSVDAYFNRSSKMVGCIVRTRDRIANGEVLDSTVLSEFSFVYTELKDYVWRIGESLGLVGPTCFQFMYEKVRRGKYQTTLKPRIIEVNARFGGGCILSLEAGFDMIQLMYEEYVLNQNVSEYYIMHFKPLTMKRVNRETFFK